MVNTVLAEYLKTNCDKYDIHELKREILSKGYSSEEFDEAKEFLCLNKSGKIEDKIKPLPMPVQTKRAKKKGFNWFAFVLVILAILIFGIMGMNYAGFDFFGFNVFG